MRALPLSFVEVLESVPHVALAHNSWSDLPPAWGHCWSHPIPINPTSTDVTTTSGIWDGVRSSSSNNGSHKNTNMGDHTGILPDFEGHLDDPAPLGYDVCRVLEFLYMQRLYIPAAEAVWTRRMTQRLACVMYMYDMCL